MNYQSDDIKNNNKRSKTRKSNLEQILASPITKRYVDEALIIYNRLKDISTQINSPSESDQRIFGMHEKNDMKKIPNLNIPIFMSGDREVDFGEDSILADSVIQVSVCL